MAVIAMSKHKRCIGRENNKNNIRQQNFSCDKYYISNTGVEKNGEKW